MSARAAHSRQNWLDAPRVPSAPHSGQAFETIFPPILLAVLACLVATSSSLTVALQFDVAEIAGGQIWRLITGHFTHWNFDHLFWDVATFAALGIVCCRRSPERTLRCVAAAALAISVTILVIHPEIRVYRGLSGIDTALFALLAVDLLRETKGAIRSMALVSLIGLIAKTSYEIVATQTLFVDCREADFTPLVSAHIVGAVIGWLFASRTDAVTDQGNSTSISG